MKLREVLVIDDSDPDLLYTTIILERAEVAEKIVPFETAREALAFLQRPGGHSADVILLDINMPEMNGFAFLEAYQRLHASSQANAVIVMLTSSPDPGDRARALAFPCVKGYVVKPLAKESAASLLAIVAAVREGGP